MVNVPYSQLSIAVTLLQGACEQIDDAASYAGRAGFEPVSRELYLLIRQTQGAIAQIEAGINQYRTQDQSGSEQC